MTTVIAAIDFMKSLSLFKNNMKEKKLFFPNEHDALLRLIVLFSKFNGKSVRCIPFHFCFLKKNFFFISFCYEESLTEDNYIFFVKTNFLYFVCQLMVTSA